ncbi:MAG: PD-(D/E)XK nuclease family protein, partial [Bacteroidota bacterium]
LTFKVGNYDEEFDTLIPVETPLYYLSRNNKNTATYSEEIRVLYVALTRARDHLIISSSVQLKKDGTCSNPKGFFKMLLEGLDTDADELINKKSFLLENVLIFLKDYKDNIQKKVFFRVEVISTDELGTGLSLESRKLNEIQSFEHILEPVSTRINNEQYSASKLMTFENDKTSYLKRYIFGLTNEDIEKDTKSHKTDTTDELIGTLAGSLIHKVLEQINDWIDITGKIKETEFDEIITGAVQGENRAIHKKLRDRIDKECRNVISTKLLKSLIGKVYGAETEYSMLLPFGDNVIIAKIDMIIENNNGDFEVWDWKTNRVDKPSDKELLAKKYSLQMKTYAYFMMLNNPEKPKYYARLLFTRLASTVAEESHWTRLFEWTKEELLSFGEELKAKIIAVSKFTKNPWKDSINLTNVR